MKRCFIALNLSQKIRQEFTQIQADLKKKNQHIKVVWVNPEIAHINLHFLGDLAENDVNVLREKLKAPEGKYGSILASLTGVGAFPSLKMPRILFLGVKQKKSNNLIKLYQDISEILRQLKIKVEERPFIAHVTLGRIKTPGAKIKIIGEEMADIDFEINSFELMESILTPKGPEYKVIKSYKL